MINQMPVSIANRNFERRIWPSLLLELPFRDIVQYRVFLKSWQNRGGTFHTYVKILNMFIKLLIPPSKGPKLGSPSTTQKYPSYHIQPIPIIATRC